MPDNCLWSRGHFFSQARCCCVHRSLKPQYLVYWLPKYDFVAVSWREHVTRVKACQMSMKLITW